MRSRSWIDDDFLYLVAFNAINVLPIMSLNLQHVPISHYAELNSRPKTVFRPQQDLSLVLSKHIIILGIGVSGPATRVTARLRLIL